MTGIGYHVGDVESRPRRFNGAPSAMSVIDAAEAAVVRRVFRLFADGVALKKIATTLNEEGLEAPNDGGRGNKRGHGWGHTTIRAMLRNERYLGHFTWNQSEWVRVPGRKSRRRVVRPSSEWVTQEHPELAIVPRELWRVVSVARVRRSEGARWRAVGTSTSSRAFCAAASAVGA